MDKEGPWLLVSKRRSLGNRIIQQAEEQTGLRLHIPRNGQIDLSLLLTNLTRGCMPDASGNMCSTQVSGMSSTRGTIIGRGRVATKHGQYNPENRF